MAFKNANFPSMSPALYSRGSSLLFRLGTAAGGGQGKAPGDWQWPRRLLHSQRDCDGVVSPKQCGSSRGSWVIDTDQCLAPGGSEGPTDSVVMDCLAINCTVSSCSPRVHPLCRAHQNRPAITHKTEQEWWAESEAPLCPLPLPQRWHVWFLHKSLALNVGILPFHCSIKGDVIISANSSK